jgi:nucleoside-diphosphate-sugar epimerase
MNIALTGATGFVGGHLLKRLIDDGHTVTALVRLGQDAKTLKHPSVKIIQRDFMNDLDLLSAVRGHDAIVHCAAYVGLWGSASTYQEINIELTKKLLDAAKGAGVARFIQMSCINAVLNDREEILQGDESLPLCQKNEFPYARSKAIAEKLVLMSSHDHFQTIVMRPAFVWGDGDIVDRQIGPAANKGKFGWFGGGRYPYSTCYVGNLCEAIALALQSNCGSGPFFIRDEQEWDLRSFLSERLRVSGYRVPTLSIPTELAWPLARFTENGWRYLPLKGEPPLVREAVRTMAYPLTVSIDYAKQAFSYAARFTISQGLAEIKSAWRIRKPQGFS